MKVLAVAVLCIAVVGAFAWTLPHKIVGGAVVAKAAHPYQVHLGQTIKLWGLFEYTSFGCGATIISDEWILTAAHCISATDPKSFIVRVGQHDSSAKESHAKNYAAVQVIKHTGYRDGESYDNDIALIKVASKIIFNDHVKPVSLAPNGYKPTAGTQAIVSGWGETNQNGRINMVSVDPQFTKASSVLLQAVTVKVVSHEVCKSPAVYGSMVTNNMICAGSKGLDSCQGDSGGPLVEESADGSRKLIGVVNFGIGCAAEGYPGVYTSVGNYISWINQHTGLGLE